MIFEAFGVEGMKFPQLLYSPSLRARSDARIVPFYRFK
jgi:hypothetical protein